MKLKTNWHSTWSAWRQFQDARTHRQYLTRKRELYCGALLVATLVEADYARYGKGGKHTFFMHNGKMCVTGSTVFRTVREFTRGYLRS